MRERIDMDRLRELVRLYRMGTSRSEAARLLGVSRMTERAYRRAIDRAGLLSGAVEDVPELEVLKAAVEVVRPRRVPAQQLSSLEPWRVRILGLRSQGLGPRAVYDRLRLEDAELAPAATYSSVKRLYRSLQREEGVRPEDVAIPVVTRPGEVAQVDFGYIGKLYDPRAGVLRKAWVFVMVLAYSRHQFARVVFDQTVETWLELHCAAFDFFGGVPRTVVPDNLKAAVICAAFSPSEPTSLNRSYRELARHYGFKVDPAPPYQPKKKGKVEAGVKYVKGGVLAGRAGQDVDAVNAELSRWVLEIAGVRLHGTTGKKPLEAFAQEEQSALLPLPQRRFEQAIWKEATVHQDSHVLFERGMYSVPWRLIGKKVWLRASPSTVSIYWEDARVATHERRGSEQRSTVETHLPEHRADLRHRSRSFWEERAARIGPDTAAYVKALFEADDVLSMLRPAQAVVTHLEKFPKERAEAACRRASFFGIHSYKALKNILARALDLEPLPVAAASPDSPQESFRFARTATELLDKLETKHEPH
jgi:transposase